MRHAFLLPVLLLGMIDFARGLEHQLAEDWVRNTVETSFGGEASQLAAYRKLQNSGKRDERATTKLEEDFKDRLTEELQTLLREDRDPENIFEFKHDAYRCGPSELGGSVFDPSSYTCSASCELTNGVPSTPIGVFHNEIVNDLLPTLHAVRSLKVAMTGRDVNGGLAQDPVGGIAFVINLLHTAENPVCLISEGETLKTITDVFKDLEKLAKLLTKVPVPQIKTIAKVITLPLKRINALIKKTNDILEEVCEKTTQIHIGTLSIIQDVTSTLTSLDQLTALMLPSLAEATCVSDNTFTLAEELTNSINVREEDPADPGARRAKRHLLEGELGSRGAAASLPATGNVSLHDRRHFAASLTPHAQDLPIRRALMYSDWEERSGFAADDSRKLALKENLTEFTTGVTSASVDVMNVFLGFFKVLDEVYRKFGILWVGVATAAESFHDAVDSLFDALEPFLGLFDVLFKIGDVFQFLICPPFLGFLCFIQDLISAAIDVLFSPIEDIFAPLIDDLVELIGLPDIGFSVSTILPGGDLPGIEPMAAIRDAAQSLVQDVISVFIDDPLPALYVMNGEDTTGLDVLYSGARVDTTVGIEDCADTYGEKRLPILFNGIQRSAWCPRGSDFTAASLFPCGGVGEVDLVTGDECVVSSDLKVPLVCVNDNYPPELLNDDGSVKFPDFLPERSDYNLQAHYACARESTVFDLGLLPAEVLATQGVGVLSCSLGRYAVDLAEIGTPCFDQEFIEFADPGNCPRFSNCDACSDIDKNEAPPGTNEYISQLPSYLDLLNAQVAAHNACNGDHMCLVGVWITETFITDLLNDLVPPELEDSVVESMVTQHLKLYEWGTSNPIYSRLESSFSQSETTINPIPSTSQSTVSGTFRFNADDEELLTKINCGEGSYLERIVWRQFRNLRFRSRSAEDVAEMSFSCYGDRSNPDATTYTGRHPERVGTQDFAQDFEQHKVADMDCRGARGGFKSLNMRNRRSPGPGTGVTEADFDDFDWISTCMDGTRGGTGAAVFLFESPLKFATCGGETPIQSLEHFWGRRFNDRVLGADFFENIIVRVICPEDGGSPLERSRDLTSLTGFTSDTNVGRYVARRDAKITEYEPDVPECERIALENAASCNALPLEEATAQCGLPEECDSAGVRYYCPVPGIDIDLPEPEKVANAFGDNNLKDASVECPDGMVYSPLEVTQGIPPFGGVNGLDDFIAAGCDSTTSTCVYPSPEGQSARIVFQCLCGEGFRPLTNEEGGCDPCPLGTSRTFIDPPDGTGLVLADSCLSCQSGTYGDVESEESSVPTCHPCPKNTYSDKIGGVGEDICIPCEAGRFTETDGGSTSVEQCIECGENFECPLGGERAACPVGLWTNGRTDASACVSCPPGTFYPADGDANSTCTPCPPGSFSNDYGQTECTPCAVGTFGRDSGADTCEVCPNGTFQDQEGADVCQACDASTPYTDSVNTTSAAGCWDDDFRSDIDMAISGTTTVVVEVGGNGSAAEDPAAVVGALEASLLAWANDWAATVLPGDRVTTDGPSTTVAQGELVGQFVLSFKADAENVLVTEAKELVHMISYPDVLTDMTTSIAQSLRNDSTSANLVMSPEPVEASFDASVVASRGQVIPLALIDFQNAELAELPCAELIARFTTPNTTNAVSEVGDGFCNGGVWNTPQCNFDGGDCCASTCVPVSLAEQAGVRATTADDCLSEEIGDGFCDPELNNEICGFDGGDCCSGTCFPGAGGECLEGTFDCRDGSEPPEDTEPRAQSCGARTMQCLDPAAARRARSLRLEHSEHASPLANKANRRLQETRPAQEDCGSSVIQWGDGVCDARLNNELCNFDGGDCCAQTCVQNPLYPESCLYFDCLDPIIGATEPVTIYDGEAPVLKNLPAQDLDVVVHECVAPTANLVISADNDPNFEGGIVVPTDEVAAGASNCSVTVTRTWAAEDFNSNSIQAQRTYQVADTQPPILTGLPADGVVVETDDPEFSFGDEVSVVAIDACSGLEAPVVYTETPVVFAEVEDDCIRSIQATWTAKDACGNSISATRIATVEFSADGCTILNPGATLSPSLFSAAPTSMDEATFAPTALELDTLAPTAAQTTSAPAAVGTIAPAATLPTPAPAGLDTIAPAAAQTTSAPATVDTIAPSATLPTSTTAAPDTTAPVAPTTPSPTVVEQEGGTPSPTSADPPAASPTTVAG